MPVGKRIRFEVFKRDKFTCQYCGKKAPDVVLHCDHMHPVAEGGTDDILNLVTSCIDCNLGKSKKLLSDATVMEKKHDQLAQLQERKEQLEMMMEWQSSLAGLDDDAVTKLETLWCELADWNGGLTEFGRSTVKKLYTRHGILSVIEAMRAAADSYFKYDDKGALTKESTKEAFGKLKAICGLKAQQVEKPWLKDLFYIRKIVENRCSYFNPWQARKILEEAFEAATNPETLREPLREMAVSVRSWTDWKDQMAAYTGQLWALHYQTVQKQWEEKDDDLPVWSEEQLAEWDRLQAEARQREEEQAYRDHIRDEQYREQREQIEKERQADRALRFPGYEDDE